MHKAKRFDYADKPMDRGFGAWEMHSFTESLCNMQVSSASCDVCGVRNHNSPNTRSNLLNYINRIWDVVHACRTVWDYGIWSSNSVSPSRIYLFTPLTHWKRLFLFVYFDFQFFTSHAIRAIQTNEQMANQLIFRCLRPDYINLSVYTIWLTVSWTCIVVCCMSTETPTKTSFSHLHFDQHWLNFSRPVKSKYRFVLRNSLSSCDLKRVRTARRLPTDWISLHIRQTTADTLLRPVFVIFHQQRSRFPRSIRLERFSAARIAFGEMHTNKRVKRDTLRKIESTQPFDIYSSSSSAALRTLRKCYQQCTIHANTYVAV